MAIQDLVRNGECEISKRNSEQRGILYSHLMVLEGEVVWVRLRGYCGCET